MLKKLLTSFLVLALVSANINTAAAVGMTKVFAIKGYNMPAAQEIIQGENDVPIAQYRMRSKTDIEIEKFILNYKGSQPINKVISSASLWINESTMIDTVGPQGNYFIFDEEFTIPANTIANLTVKVNLHPNNLLDENTFSIGVRKIIAKETQGNLVAGYIPYKQLWSNAFTVLNMGKLTFHESNSPDSSIVIAGTNGFLASQYKFVASDEDFEVTELTVINDPFSAFDTPVATPTVDMVWIEYPDSNGVMQTASQAMVNGTANFSGLNPPLYVNEGGTASVKVYADIQTTDFGQSLSGQEFRLGIQENNDETTFNAIGVSSAAAEHNPNTLNGHQVNRHVIRFTKPTVSLDGAGNLPLTDGKSDLYALKVSADSAGGMEVKRLTFNVNMNMDSGDSLSQFRIREDLNGVDFSTTEVTITYEFNGEDLHQTTTDFDAADGINDGKGQGKVVVTFTTPRTIAAGANKTFILSAQVSGANNVQDMIATQAAGDEGLVTDSAEDIMDDTAAHFVWSDKSSTNPVHSEDTLDWTNGHLVDGLPVPAKILNY